MKKNYIIFDLRKFLVDADHNATFPILTYLRLTQFSHTEMDNFSDDFISLNQILNFDTLKLATFMTILCFWSSDVTFTPRYARFQTIWCPEQDTQFWSGGYFAFSGYPIKKKREKEMVSIDAARFAWSETTKKWKSPKIDSRKNSATATKYLP